MADEFDFEFEQVANQGSADMGFGAQQSLRMSGSGQDQMAHDQAPQQNGTGMGHQNQHMQQPPQNFGQPEPQQQQGQQQGQQQQPHFQPAPPPRPPPGPPPSSAQTGPHQGQQQQEIQEATMSGCKIYVANLYWWTTDAEVEALCSPYGDIASLEFVTDRSNGKSKGAVLVEYTTPEAAVAARDALQGQSLQGRPIVATFQVQGPGAKLGPPFVTTTVEGQRAGQGGPRGARNDGGRGWGRGGRGGGGGGGGFMGHGGRGGGGPGGPFGGPGMGPMDPMMMGPMGPMGPGMGPMGPMGPMGGFGMPGIMG